MKVLESLEQTVERRRNWIKPVIIAFIVLILVMWVYIFLLAPKNSAGSIDDKAWTTSAEATCSAANQKISQLAFVNPADNSPTGLIARGKSVAEGNAIITQMLADLGKTPPKSDIGQTIVTKWLQDWHTFLNDRVNYANALLAGSTTQFGESQVDNAPISDFIGSIADRNNMNSCSTIPLT
jgi:hypothetical protein